MVKSQWAKSVGSVLMWYGTNIGIICINKSLLSHHDFNFPIFLTFLHMLSCMFWSEVMCKVGVLKKQNAEPQQFRAIVLLGTLFCVSVVSGNIAFKYIEVSFAQAIGATTPVFTAAMTAFFLGRYERRVTYLTLIPVVVGSIIATIHEPRFHMVGFLFGLNAAWTRAARSVIQEKLLTKGAKLDSLNLLRIMAPISATYLGVITLLTEFGGIKQLFDLLHQPVFLFAFSVNLTLAYFVNLGGMIVSKYNGALTLQVLGNMKGAVATAVSVSIFQNPISLIAVGGYSMCIAGVWAYGNSSKKKPPAMLSKANSDERV